MPQSNYRKEQKRTILATNRELDAWEALRREPGLIGRLARRGKHMKRDYVGGRRSFEEGDEDTESGEIGSSESGGGFGGGDSSVDSQQSGGGDFGHNVNYGTEDRGGYEGEGDTTTNRNTTTTSNGGGETAAQREARLAREAAAAEAKAKKEAEEKAKKEKLEKEAEVSKARRKELAGEYGEYKDEFGDLKGKADYKDTRDDLSGYQDTADTMAGEAGTKFGGYESAISKMADRGGQVAGLGGQVGTAAGKMGTMAADATDTQKLMEDRGLYTGMLEQGRKTGEESKLANLRRSMASAGSSPEEIARAEAEAKGGAGAAGSGMRSDQLQGAMAAMQAKQGQMSQAAGMLQGQAGMYGQQAGMYGQQANMYGQAQNLGLQKTQAQAGMYGQGLQARTGLMQMGSSLANQQQMSMQNQIAQQQGLIGSQAGMTDAQMQNEVAKQNAARQERLAREGIMVQQQTNAANQPKGPSQSEQLMGLVKTGAMVKVAMACIPEGTKIDTPDGKVAIEDVKVGIKINGYYGPETEVLQVHQYKEDPVPPRFYHIQFDNGGAVDCCDMHKISGKRAKDCKVGDIISANRITSITKYNGVRRSYDLLTEDRGYRIDNIQIDSMIEEMAETIVEFNSKIAA